MVKKLVKSWLTAFISSLFFLISSIGLDATNWVFNMPSYASLISIVFFIFFFLKSQFDKKLSYALIAAIFYFVAYLLAPIRTHGLPGLAIMLDVFLLIQLAVFRKKFHPNFKEELKRVGLRQLIMILVLFLVLLTGSKGGIKSDLTLKLSEGLIYMTNAVKMGNLSFLLNPFIIFGRFFLPETFLQSTIKLPFLRIPKAVFLSLFFFSPFLLMAKTMLGRINFLKNKHSQLFISSLILWTIFATFVVKNSTNYLDPVLRISTYFGGFITIFWIFYIFKNIHKPISNISFAGLAWAYLSFLFPWMWTPDSLFGTVHRYFVMSSLGVALLIGTLNQISKKGKIIAFGTSVLIIIMHFSLTNNYFSYLAKVRNTELNDKIWSKLTNVEAVGKERGPLIFYFESENSATLYYLITFGFPPHMGILYNIKELDRIPLALDRWEDAVKAVKTGENMPAYGYPAKPASIKNFYAFKLMTNGDLVDISKKKRAELVAELLNKN